MPSDGSVGGLVWASDDVSSDVTPSKRGRGARGSMLKGKEENLLVFFC